MEQERRVWFVGRSTCDVLYRVAGLPEENTKVFAEGFHAAPGGPALNAALTHAQLGGRAVLVSAVGAGPWAAVVRAELERHGVELVDLAEGTGYQTPLACAWVNAQNGSRTVVNPPADGAVLPVWTRARARAALERLGGAPAVALTDGFHLPETLQLLAECRAQGAEVVLDGGSWKPGTEALAELLTVAICGERFHALGAAERPEAVIGWFEQRGVGRVAVTRGERPIVAAEQARRFEVAIEPVAAVDTLGAGDVLHGAFCHELARGAAFEAALRRASRLATQKCRGVGVGAWRTN